MNLREKLIEALAKRRCLAAGYALDFQARRLTAFAHDDNRPLWRTYFLDQARADVVEFCAKAREVAGLAFVFGLAFSPVILVGFVMIYAGGWR